MREILFRGKRIDNDEWVYGAFSMKDCDSPFGEMLDRPSIIKYEDPCSGFWFRVDPDTVGQFTGLTDKNGKKIFEGDIVQYYGTYALEVFIENGHTKIRCFDTVTNSEWEELFFGDDEYLGECEVIGNIHDNPELMEVE